MTDVGGAANGAPAANGAAAGGSESEAEEAGDDVALAHLRTMSALLDQYYHPSNHGGCGGIWFLKIFFEAKDGGGEAEALSPPT